ncbi:MAG: type II toxin-antitoxin system Phd/YefM family antitoxin [Oscillospiraceae bacterium]|jgi:antitoxin (DNA-binding transcriptional repressor) of toxin-antitoxin stability system|nr:type II toxin-antitoxin system Phd/YefM family antitoxin [Oscillospiraceae bacterium]
MKTVNVADFFKDFYMYLSVAENGEGFTVEKDGKEIVAILPTEQKTERETPNYNKKEDNPADFSKWIGYFRKPDETEEDVDFDEKELIGEYLCEKYNCLG